MEYTLLAFVHWCYTGWCDAFIRADGRSVWRWLEHNLLGGAVRYDIVTILRYAGDILTVGWPLQADHCWVPDAGFLLGRCWFVPHSFPLQCIHFSDALRRAVASITHSAADSVIRDLNSFYIDLIICSTGAVWCCCWVLLIISFHGTLTDCVLVVGLMRYCYIDWRAGIHYEFHTRLFCSDLLNLLGVSTFGTMRCSGIVPTFVVHSRCCWYRWSTLPSTPAFVHQCIHSFVHVFHFVSVHHYHSSVLCPFLVLFCCFPVNCSILLPGAVHSGAFCTVPHYCS